MFFDSLCIDLPLFGLNPFRDKVRLLLKCRNDWLKLGFRSKFIWNWVKDFLLVHFKKQNLILKFLCKCVILELKLSSIWNIPAPFKGLNERFYLQEVQVPPHSHFQRAIPRERIVCEKNAKGKVWRHIIRAHTYSPGY